MSKNFFYRLQSNIVGGAMIIAVASILSRVLGLARDRLLAFTFGAGDVLDTYYAAFRIPDLIFNTLVLGALSAAFIPVFLRIWQKDKEESFKVTNSILNIILLGLLFLGVIFFVLAPQIIPLIAPGFSLEKQSVTIKLTRIMLVSILFFGISNVIASILNSLKKFMAYALAPIMYNLGIIAGILFFVPLWGPVGLAWGVVMGSFLHLVVQLPATRGAGWRYQFLLNFKNKAVRQIGKLMLPRTFGLAVMQVNQLVMNIIASTLLAGSVAVFNLANNLQYFPVSVFGISLAITSFPVFTEAFSNHQPQEFVIHFSRTVRRILFLIIPTTVLFLLLRAQIVRLVLGAGKFDWEDTVLTAQALGFFSISLFSQSLIPVLARAFYALEDTKTPVLISFFSVLVNIGLGILFGFWLGVGGLALAFSLASILNMILLMTFLRTRLGDLDDKKIMHSTGKIILASLIMGLVVQGLAVKGIFIFPGIKYLMGSLVNMQTFGGVFIQALVSVLGGSLVYLLLAFVFKFEEIEIIRKWVAKARSQFLGRNNNLRETRHKKQDTNKKQ